MGKQRRSFSEEFKRKAVRRAALEDRPLTSVARELGIHPSLLQTWRRKSEERGVMVAGAKPGESLDEENRRLRRENASLREDREILKSGGRFNGSVQH